MNNEEDKLDLIFSGALAKGSEGERQRYLAQACGADAELRAQVDTLLAAHAEAGNFLKQSVITSSTGQIGEAPGSVIGRYKLLEQIGEGGFGVIFMAEQQEPVRRMVALKILKAGMDTKEVVARFEAERQALALMDHPNIARVLDGGVTAGGRPYFVMDLVKGVPITEFCEQRRLPTDARLQLFVKVCAGVQHAHQKGIIHRDLKPTNVLVTLHDGEAVPKVIDFGVAKAIGQKLTERTLFTRFEQLIGTPAYMSPEQAEWSGLDIDTRSDIYSLGVLLYELLTSTTPLEKETLARAGLDEVRRLIRETEPPNPSTRLQALGQRLEEIASRRHSEPGALTRLVRGELDWIVVKCLEKDRTRRYETSSELALDIQRHLGGELVLARAPGRVYRFGKVVRKNKLAFASGAIVLASLVAGLAVSLWMFVQERQAKRGEAHLRELADAREIKAEIDAARARELARVLKDTLKGATPDVAKGRDTTILREILQRALVQAHQQLTNQPEVQVELLGTLADVYEELQLYNEMDAVAKDRAVIAKARFGENSVYYADALGGIGAALRHLDRLDQSEACLRKAVALRAELSGGDDTATADLLEQLGYVLIDRGKWDEAQSLYRNLLALRPKTELNRAELLNDLALVLRNQGQTAEAENLQRQSVELGKRSDRSSVSLVSELHNLGDQMSNQDRLLEAEKFYREALATSRKLWGNDNSKLTPTVVSLVDLLAKQKKYAEAERVFAELLDSGAPRRPEDAPLLAERADFFAVRARWSDAVSNLTEAIRLDPANSSQYGTLARVLASYGEKSAYRLLSPQITNSAPPGTFAFLESQSDLATWQIIDDIRPAAGINARSLSIVIDAATGRLYCAGYAIVDAQGKTAGIIRASGDSGKSWATLDTWQAGYYSENEALCLAPGGSLFTVGHTVDKPGKGATVEWSLRRSSDHGATWTLKDRVSSGFGGQAHCRAVCAAPSGEIYAAGLTATNFGSGGWVWLVRKSSDDGATWKTVDSLCNLQHPNEARAIGFGPNGAIFVAGALDADFGDEHDVWTVRRSTNGGASWTTVDSYQTSLDLAAEALAIAVDSSGLVYVAGMARGVTNGGRMTDQWVVRRSVNGGATWETVDNLEIGTRHPNDFDWLSGATGIAIAPSGAILVCGCMTGPDRSMRWLVRSGMAATNGAVRWTTIDNYQMAPGHTARANCVITDPRGNIYVTGRATDASGTEHWLTRRLSQDLARKISLR